MTFRTAEIKPVECCNIPGNLVRTMTGVDRGYDQCQVCGRKHYGMKADLSEILSRAQPVNLSAVRVFNPLLTSQIDVYTR